MITKQYIPLAIWGAFLIATLGVWGVIFRAERGVLTVAFLDIGQGDAIFIETPHGRQILIDGGKSSVVLPALGGVMPWYDRTIDIVLATHPDQDHAGGLPSVLLQYDVSFVVENGASHDTRAYEAFLRAAAQEESSGARRGIARRGQRIVLEENVFLDILFPDRDPNGWDTNDGSIVTLLSYGQSTFLLTGDAPIGVEEYLVRAYGALLDADVLKLGHHGSKTSSSQIFLSAVSPEYAVVSAGRDNQYGHPHKEVTDRVKDMGVPTFSTAESGTVVFESDGGNIRVLGTSFSDVE
ncbi:MAG: ComEC/Rec2 family competence protein [Patescibacteria group bacterium]